MSDAERTRMYDQLAAVYDRFVDWPARLARELPPLTAWLGGPPLRIADVGCGTGGHAMALGAAGYEVVGFDPSPGALDTARARAAEQQLANVSFEVGKLGELARLGAGEFDAVICLGNTLPHITAPDALAAVWPDLHALAAPGGRVLLGLRNLPLVVDRGQRYQPLKSTRDADGSEWLFERVYDFHPHGLLDFNFVTYHRPGPDGAWTRDVQVSRLRAWPLETLLAGLAGWAEVRAAANLAGDPFDEAASGDLFLSARRPA